MKILLHAVCPQLRLRTGTVVALLLTRAISSFCAPGDVDRSFNPGARVNDYVYSIALQPDGKIIVGGLFTSPSTLIARLNTNGSVDTNFNVGTGANGIVYAVALQPDGKVLVAGAFTRLNGISRNRIARLHANGSVDTSFDPGLGADARIRAMALQPDGRVLIGGDFLEVDLTPRIRIARLNSNGSLDATFDPGSGADEEVFCIALQTNGQAVVGGYFQSINDVPRTYVARLNANGAVDQGFDAAGVDLDVDSIVLQPDGRMIIGGGFGSINGVDRGRVARLNFDGSLDGSFDPGLGVDFHVGAVAWHGGKVVVGGSFGSVNGTFRNNVARFDSSGTVDAGFDPGGGTDAIVNAVLVQPDGKVLLGGNFKLVNGATRNYLARLNIDGRVDTSFNPSTGVDYPVLAVSPDTDGKVLIGGYFTSIGAVPRNYLARLDADGALDLNYNSGLGANNRVVAITPQPDGKALVAGLFTSLNGTNRGRIARLNSDGSLDLTFDPGTGANSDVLAIARHTDGRILICGEFTSVNGTNRQRIARLHPNGSLDTTFDPGLGADATVRSLAVQADGKVLVAGDFTFVGGTNRNRIARFNGDGTLDTAFNPGSGANGPIESVVLQPDGKVIVGGEFTSFHGTSRPRVARLHSNGTIDTAFNPGAGADGVVLSVAVDSSNRVLIGGEFFTFQGVLRRHVARLHANGSLDASFDPGVGANDTVTTVALQPDGEVLVGGFFNTFNAIGRSGVARLDVESPSPTLLIRRVAAGVALSWPAAFTNYTLQSTMAVASTNLWSDVGTAPTQSGNQWVITNAASASASYFRLNVR